VAALRWRSAVTLRSTALSHAQQVNRGRVGRGSLLDLGAGWQGQMHKWHMASGTHRRAARQTRTRFLATRTVSPSASDDGAIVAAVHLHVLLGVCFDVYARLGSAPAPTTRATTSLLRRCSHAPSTAF
jgi:hypothetical protein